MRPRFTIAQRLIALTAVPLVVLAGFGVWHWTVLRNIERQTQTLANVVAPGLSAVAHQGHGLMKMRMELDAAFNARVGAMRTAKLQALGQAGAEMLEQLEQLARTMPAESAGRRHLENYRALIRAWLSRVGPGLAEDVDAGRREDLRAGLDALVVQLDRWIAYHDAQAGRAAEQTENELKQERKSTISTAGIVVVALAAGCVLVVRSFVMQLHRLRDSVAAIAGGDYQRPVPLADARDEIGDLARAVAVLKTVAAARERERWLRERVARLAVVLQEARNEAEFGRALLDGVLPADDGPAGFYFSGGNRGRPLVLAAALTRGEHGTAADCVPRVEAMARRCAAAKRPLEPEAAEESGGTAGRAAAAWPIEGDSGVAGVFVAVGAGALNRPLMAEVSLIAGLIAESLHRLKKAEAHAEALALSEATLRKRTTELERLNGRLQEQAHLLEQQAEELVRQRQAIAETEVWYRQLVESAPDGLLVADRDGLVVLANVEAGRLFASTSAELAGARVDRLLPRAGDALRAGDGRAEGRRSDGTRFPAEFSQRALQESPGRRGCTCFLVRDITERLKADAQIRQQRATLAALLDAIPDRISYQDPQGALLGCNSAYARSLGRVPAEIVGRRMEELTGREAAEQEREQNREILRQRRRVQSEARGEGGDGEPLWLETVKLPVTDEVGQAVGLLTIVRDVTEPRAAEAAAMRERQQLQRIFDTAPAGVVITVDGVVQFANPRLLAMADLRVGGPDGGQVVQGEIAARIERELSVGNIVRDVEMKVRDRGGNVHDVLATYLPTEFGGRPGVLGWLTDIGGLKEAEAQIRRARDLAEAAGRSKGEFLANMSHELRTPMNAIIGLSRLAVTEAPEGKLRGYVKKVNQAAMNLLGIIDDILDFSKIEAGRLQLEDLEFRTEDVLDNLVALFGLRAETKGLELLFAISPDVPEALRGDPLRLGQVLANLVGNALKFTDAGEVVLAVSVRARERDHVVLEFAITDTGIGISEEQSSRLFQSFGQADTSTTRRFGGSGLGLVISRRLTELMGGAIEVQSSPGRGSTFRFSARLGVAAAARARPVPKVAEWAARRVLVVDDNAASREIMTAALRHLGMDAEQAESGASALRVSARAEAENRPFDLVLMDWKMPDMDGIACARELTRRGGGEPKIVLATAFGRDDATAAAAAAEVRVAASLTKPVMPSALAEAVGAALATEGRDRSSAGQAGTDAGARETEAAAGPSAAVNPRAGGPGDFAVRFARAVAAGDFAAAEQEARTLKTSAAERGADGLRAAAERLETACRERTAADWQGMLDAVRREARASEPEAVTEIARRLQDLLRQSDSRAGELAEELATVAARFGEEARFRPVLEAVAAYEFDAALSALRAAVALSA